MADQKSRTSLKDDVFRPNVSERPTRKKLDEFLIRRNFHAPDIESISVAYQKLNHQLHHEIQGRTALDPTSIPQVCAFPVGPFMLGIPSRGIPCKIVVFGSISSEIYHDLVWEAVQETQEYAQYAAGIYEVKKLPVLRFSIYFQGHDFDLHYHQSFPLVAKYHSQISPTAILDAPLFFLEQNCTKDVKDAVVEAQKYSKQWMKFESRKNLKETYYLCRALASVQGSLDDTMDARIIAQLLYGAQQDGRVDELPDFVQGSELESWTDQEWLNGLEHYEQRPISEFIPSSLYLTIDVMHAGCSESQASKWLRHIESRLPKLQESLASKLPRHVESRLQETRPEKTVPGIAEPEEDDHLHPSLDSSTWKDFDFEARGSDWESNRDSAIEHLRQYKSELATSMLVSNVPHSEEHTGGFGIEGLLNLSPNKPHVFQWPHRLVRRGTDPKADGYEGHYVFGLRVSPGQDDKIEAAVKHWEKSILAHESTLVSKCFISWNLRTPTDFQQWETTDGHLESCKRILTRPFLPPPDPLIKVESDSAPLKAASKRKTPATDLLLAKAKAKAKQEPTAKLRQARDILNRLHHDRSFNIDEYYIGYQDRFTEKIMEVSAQDWVGETTHEAFIPESRIYYFKRRVPGGREEIMWDRKARIDRIFGSGVVFVEEEE